MRYNTSCKQIVGNKFMMSDLGTVTGRKIYRLVIHRLYERHDRFPNKIITSQILSGSIQWIRWSTGFFEVAVVQ